MCSASYKELPEEDCDKNVKVFIVTFEGFTNPHVISNKTSDMVVKLENKLGEDYKWLSSGYTDDSYNSYPKIMIMFEKVLIDK